MVKRKKVTEQDIYNQINKVKKELDKLVVVLKEAGNNLIVDVGDSNNVFEYLRITLNNVAVKAAAELNTVEEFDLTADYDSKKVNLRSDDGFMIPKTMHEIPERDRTFLIKSIKSAATPVNKGPRLVGEKKEVKDLDDDVDFLDPNEG